MRKKKKRRVERETKTRERREEDLEETSAIQDKWKKKTRDNRRTIRPEVCGHPDIKHVCDVRKKTHNLVGLRDTRNTK